MKFYLKLPWISAITCHNQLVTRIHQSQKKYLETNIVTRRSYFAAFMAQLILGTGNRGCQILQLYCTSC